VTSAPRTSEEVTSNPPIFTGTAIVASCVGFLVIGALQAVYGPAIPTFQQKFGVTAGGAGLSLSAHFTGALLGVLLFHRLRRWATNRVLLGAGYGLMALGAGLFAVASNWNVALAAAFLGGLGFGGIDYGVNLLFTIGIRRRGTAMLNLLHANFGIGAVAGPPLIGWIGPSRYPWVFLGLALVSAGLLLTLRGVRQHAGTLAHEGDGHTRSRDRALAIVGAFIVIYVLHVAVETGVGGWEPTHLEALGYSTAGAATATSAYWLMLTLGRFLVIPITLRVSAATIVTVSCVGMTICLALTAVPGMAVIAYLGVGLFIAPIFPTGLAWLNRVVPATGGATAYVIAASMLGGVLFPPLLGLAVESSGVRALPVLLGALAAACALVSVWAMFASRRAAPAPERPETAGPERHPATYEGG